MLSGLRDMGCAFSKVHDTAELFASLRGEGKLSGPYLEIDWTAPGEWQISER